jgi:hypothetical protein
VGDVHRDFYFWQAGKDRHASIDFLGEVNEFGHDFPFEIKVVKVYPSKLVRAGNLTCLLRAVVNHDPRVDTRLRTQDFPGDMSGFAPNPTNKNLPIGGWRFLLTWIHFLGVYLVKW